MSKQTDSTPFTRGGLHECARPPQHRSLYAQLGSIDLSLFLSLGIFLSLFSVVAVRVDLTR